jgi:hypothetical protein
MTIIYYIILAIFATNGIHAATREGRLLSFIPKFLYGNQFKTENLTPKLMENIGRFISRYEFVEKEYEKEESQKIKSELSQDLYNDLNEMVSDASLKEIFSSTQSNKKNKIQSWIYNNISEPLTECTPCMSSIYGIIFYVAYTFDLMQYHLFALPVMVFAICGANNLLGAIAFKRNQDVIETLEETNDILNNMSED